MLPLPPLSPFWDRLQSIITEHNYQICLEWGYKGSLYLWRTFLSVSPAKLHLFFLFYLQLRAAKKACGFLWMVPLKIIIYCEIHGTRGFVSKLYCYILKNIYPPLTINSDDIPDLAPSFDWDSIWDMVMHASRNPDHQQSHLNFNHRIYMTPRKLYSMKLKPDPNCMLCHTGEFDTFYNIIWECPGVVYFLNMVKENLSTILNV